MELNLPVSYKYVTWRLKTEVLVIHHDLNRLKRLFRNQVPFTLSVNESRIYVCLGASICGLTGRPVGECGLVCRRRFIYVCYSPERKCQKVFVWLLTCWEIKLFYWMDINLCILLSRLESTADSRHVYRGMLLPSWYAWLCIALKMWKIKFCSTFRQIIDITNGKYKRSILPTNRWRPLHGIPFNGSKLWNCWSIFSLRIDNSWQGMIRATLLSSAAILCTVSYYTSNYR